MDRSAYSDSISLSYASWKGLIWTTRRTSGHPGINVTPTGDIKASGIVKKSPSYTVYTLATLPRASSVSAGAMAFVSNGSGDAGDGALGRNGSAPDVRSRGGTIAFRGSAWLILNAARHIWRALSWPGRR